VYGCIWVNEGFCSGAIREISLEAVGMDQRIHSDPTEVPALAEFKFNYMRDKTSAGSCSWAVLLSTSKILDQGSIDRV
jgi:hypothetical protein